MYIESREPVVIAVYANSLLPSYVANGTTRYNIYPGYNFIYTDRKACAGDAGRVHDHVCYFVIISINR